MAKIEINNLKVCLCIGVTEAERAYPQMLSLDLALATDIRKASMSDQIEDTIDYMQVSQTIKSISEKSSFCLLEKFVSEVALALLDNFALIQEVHIKATKNVIPEALGVSVSANFLRSDS